MDLAYIEHWSLLLDLQLLVRTASAALRGDRRPPVNRAEIAPALSRARYLGLVDGDNLLKTQNDCDVSIVVVTHESIDDIGACLDSIRQLPDVATREVIVVDNASKDGTADLVASRFPEVRLIRKRHRDGFATNVNIGAVAASGRHVLILNPDTEMFSDGVDRLVEHLDLHPEVGAVGPRLVYADGRHQASARRFPTPMNSIVRRTPLRRVVGATSGTNRHLMSDVELHDVMDVDWLLGAVLAVRAEALVEVGGLDDGYRLYCEDIDFCWRLHEAGWGVNYLTTVTVQHALGELTAKRFFTVRTVWHFRSMLRFVRMHGLATPSWATPRPSVARRPVRRLDLIELSDSRISLVSESAA
jgi:GT2 family glycosyltransferase